jgi:hypothetical protein
VSAPPELQIKKFSQICFPSVKDSPTPTKKSVLYDLSKSILSRRKSTIFFHKRVIFQQDVLARIACFSLIPHRPPENVKIKVDTKTAR